MIGFFGVAPALGKAIPTATSGPYGGNMDYRLFGPGTVGSSPCPRLGRFSDDRQSGHDRARRSKSSCKIISASRKACLRWLDKPEARNPRARDNLFK
jgi:hypothetical protein